MNGFQPIGELLPGDDSRKLEPAPDEMPLSAREELVLELVHVGISLRKARHLVDRYPAERIRRQLDWLPRRPARRPAPLLIAAIENDYDPPAYAS
jgi:hypothetical protein